MPEFDVYGDAFFDVSEIKLCAPSHVRKAAKGQLEGSKIRYDVKMAKYPELGHRFKPLVVESTGGWHPYHSFIKNGTLLI
jgi:dethiobiotin synthetase